MSDNIKVAIKVRPLIKREKDENLPIQWITQGNAIVAVDAEIKKRGDGGFQFDHIFDTNTDNNDIFDSIVSPIIDATVNGFNGTVFAYGQTSSGKTYTMMGTQEEDGVIPLAIKRMFDTIANTSGREFLLRVSYLEIYNEKINDLLNKDEVDLKVHEDTNGQVFVKCKEEVANSPENILSIMNKGDKIRRIGETNMNERSSRSHTIFRITIESREADAGPDAIIQVSQLNMVDLAGSERARQTGTTGERFKEGRHINLSLSSLALVIKQLSESQEYVNFRDSKLTRLLQTSLGGNATTAIICAITPAALEETQCTLSFAARAKSIKTKPQLNEVMSDGVLLKRYAKQIDKLQAELERLKQRNWNVDMLEMESKMQEKDRINEDLEERIRLLQTRIVAGVNRNNVESFKSRKKRRQTWCGTGACNLNDKLHSPKNLSPIKEMSPWDSNRRQCHIDMSEMDPSFQIAYTDFELELLRNEEDCNEENSLEYDVITYRKNNRVQFKEETIIHKSSYTEDSTDVTPEKMDIYTQTTNIRSPGTPKENLRRRLRDTLKEYTQLQEYTTLEKQLYVDQHNVELKEKLAQFSMLEKQVENLISDRNSYEHIASDLRKRLHVAESHCFAAEEKLNTQMAQLDRIPELEKELARLSKQVVEVQDIPQLREKVTNLTAEKEGYEFITSELRKKFIEAEQRNILLEEQLAKRNVEANEEPLIQFSFVDENAGQTETEARLTVLASENDEMQRKLNDLQEKLNEAELRNKSMNDELNKQQIAYSQNLDELEEMRDKLIFNENTFKKTVYEMQDKQQAEVKKSQDQEERIHQLISEKNEFELMIGELQEKLLEAEVTNTSMEGKMKEYERHAHKFQQLEEQIQDIVTEKVEFERINDELKGKLKEVEATCNSLKSNLNVHQQNTCDLEKRLQNLVTEKEGFENTIEELKEKLKESELASSLLQNKLNERKTDAYNIDDLRVATQNNELQSVLPELNKTSNESYDDSTEEEFNTPRAMAQNDVVQQEEKHLAKENLSVPEDSKTSDTVCKLQEMSKEIEVCDHLTENGLDESSESHISLNASKSKVKDESYLLIAALRKNEIETTTNKSEKESTNTERRISVCNESKDQELLSSEIQELEAQVGLLKYKNEQYEHIITELCEQSIKETSSVKESSIDNDDSDHLRSHVNDSQNNLQDYSSILIQRENVCVKDDAILARSMDYHDYELCNGDSSKIDLSSTSLDEDSAKLSADLILKNQELEEIKGDVRSLKEDIVKLQKTIILLSTENTDLANKLSKEKECAEQELAHLQGTIDELYTRNSQIMDEKIVLENNLSTFNEELESLRSKIPEVNINEKEMTFKYEEQINVLTTKNKELLCDITDKMKELEALKESKSLLYEHDCMYKDKLMDLKEKYKYIMNENDTLSTELIDKIEENEGLKQECDILKNKLELSLKSKEEVSDSNVEQLKTENTSLKIDLMELKTVMKTLKEENSKMSNQLVEAIEDNTRKISSCNNTLHLSTIFNSTSTVNDTTMNKSMTDGIDFEERILKLQEEVNHLTNLNRKLSDLKFSTCDRCTHLKEVTDNRRLLKLEVDSLNHRLANLQKKFDLKTAKTDALIMKAKEDINTTNSSFNASFTENMNVSFVEEKLQSLNYELQSLKDDYDKLSDLYKEKCDEVEELQKSGIADLTLGDDANCSFKKVPSKTSLKMDNIVKVMSNLQKEFLELKEYTFNVRLDLEKFTNERNRLSNENALLKIANEELLQKQSENEFSLATASRKADFLESEMTDITKKLQELTVRYKEIENEKLRLEIETECLKEEKMTKEQLINELRQNTSCLQNELDLMKKQKEELESNHILINEYELLKTTNDELMNSMTIITQELADRKKETECKSLEFEEKINKYTSENEYLKQELIRLRDVEEKLDKVTNEYQFKYQHDKTLAEDNKNLKEALNNASKDILKEIKSLKPKVNTKEYLNKTVEELFQIFLQTIVAKEKEIVKTMQNDYNKEKQRLEDEKQQSVDAEKRKALWVKELESEIEKLQSDLSERENTLDVLQKEVSHLQKLLEENNCDRNTLKEKIDLLEMDINNLHAELDKYTKSDIVNEEAIIVARQRERQAKETIKNKEAEFQMKLNSEKELHNKQVEELACTIDSIKTKNMELISNIECLEANQKQLKNIIDLKNNEQMKSNQIIQTIQTELTQLTEAYNELNQELEAKKLRVEEIKELLKTKCDNLTEYKNNLEIYVSENNYLKQQVEERKSILEQQKAEIKALKMANEEKIDALKEKVSLEELKCTELNNQIAELNNKNAALITEMDTLRDNRDALLSKCTSLERRVRNSTSKIQAEEQMEELKDLNKSLRNNLDGASNRITELHTAKTDLLKQLVVLERKYESVYNENKELQGILTSYKSKHNNIDATDEKYNVLLREKNQIALELEAMKVQLYQKNQDIENYVSKIDELTKKNAELDQESEELAEVIRQNENDYAKLQDKYYMCRTEADDLLKEVATFKKGNQNQMIRTIHTSLADKSENFHDDECSCTTLKNKIRELQLEIAAKNGKIASLELKIRSESFPYQMKCKELQEHILAQNNQISELKAEIKRLQLAMLRTSTKECDVCKQKLTNRRNQSCQTIPNNHVLRFCCPNSGIIEEEMRITKLEKEKKMIMDVCRSRCRTIKELEKRLEEFEKKLCTKSS